MAAAAPETFHVLVVDKDPLTREEVARALREAGVRVTVGRDGKDVLERSGADIADVALVRSGSRVAGALEVVSALKQAVAARGRFMPVVLLSDDVDSRTVVEALRGGADDVLGAATSADVLVARIEALLRLKAAVDEARRKQAQLEDTALVDPDTGLFNSRYLKRRVHEEFHRAHRYTEPLSVMVAELAAWPAGANGAGSGTGNGTGVAEPVRYRLLTQAAHHVAKSCRQTDILAVAAPGALCVILPHTNFTGALVVAERVGSELRAAKVQEQGLTASCESHIGVSCFPGRDVLGAEDLLTFAQAALARAKEEGRGRICLYQHQGYLIHPR